jgi:hypothetical protein
MLLSARSRGSAGAARDVNRLVYAGADSVDERLPR